MGHYFLDILYEDLFLYYHTFFCFSGVVVETKKAAADDVKVPVSPKVRTGVYIVHLK